MPAFADVRVRQALTHAVDRALIARRSSRGWRRSRTARSSPCRGHTADDVANYAFDPARARALLDEAGWRDTNGDGVRESDGQPLAFTLITQAGFAVRESVAQVLQRQFRDVGVEWRSQLHDGTSISKLWFEGNFDAMLHWWQMPADPELTLFFADDRMPPAGRNINYVDDDALTTAGLRGRSHGRSSRAQADPGRSAGAHRRAGNRDSALRRDQARRRARRGCTASRAIRPTPGRSGTCTSGRSVSSRQLADPPGLRRRGAEAVPLLLLVSRSSSSRLIHAVPGGPTAVYLSNPGVRPEDIERLRRALGLDRPLWRAVRAAGWRPSCAATGATASATAGRCSIASSSARRRRSSWSPHRLLLGDRRGAPSASVAAVTRRAMADRARSRRVGGRHGDPGVLVRPGAAARVRHRARLAAVVRPRHARRRQRHRSRCSIW